MRPTPTPMTYASSGVDIDRGNLFVESIKALAKSTSQPGADGQLGGFGGIFDPKAFGLKDPLFVAATDGVGTKLRLAMEHNTHKYVGIDLVAMCVNDIIVQGARPLIFLDYFACGQLDMEKSIRVVEGIKEGCMQAGCTLLGGETAEMPGMYQNDDYDIAGFCIGAVEREKLLTPHMVDDSCAIIGLPSSGVHSNGFSLVRKILDHHDIKLSDTVPFSPDLSYGDVLTEPTRIYVKPLLQLMQVESDIPLVKGMSHITGGGFYENLPRVFDEKHYQAIIDMSTFDVPPLFKHLQELGNVHSTEMFRTFNCGIGMMVFVPKSKVNTALNTLKSENPIYLGEVVTKSSPSDPSVLLKGLV